MALKHEPRTPTTTCRQVVVEKLARGKASHRSEVAARKLKGQSAARLAKQHAKELAERVKLLSSVTLFAALEGPAHDAAESVVEVEFLPGQTVVTQGDPGTDMFIILEGGAGRTLPNKARARTDVLTLESFVMRSCVVVPRASQIVKKEQHLRALKKRQWFGELALTSNALRNATVRGTARCGRRSGCRSLRRANLRLLKMSQQSFVKVCERDGGSTSRRWRPFAAYSRSGRLHRGLRNIGQAAQQPRQGDETGQIHDRNDYICTQGAASSSFYHL